MTTEQDVRWAIRAAATPLISALAGLEGEQAAAGLDELRSMIEEAAADRQASIGHRFCLCSDPDYCLRNTRPDYRRRAIAYRRKHGAPVPADADRPEDVTAGRDTGGR